jgi:hypothetical protein
MGRVAIATENRTGEGGDRFPKIKLSEKGQKTRFTIIEVPWREYIHYLKAPTFDENGRVVKETKTRRDSSSYEDYKLSFEGSPICLGDEATLREKGLDEKNCPACEASVKSGETAGIPGPIQRFAVNVIEYGLKGNTWDIKRPFTADIKVWTFTGKIYDEIEGIQKEIGDLRKHDITLECDDPYWQRNKLGFKMEPGYSFGDKAYIRELLTTPGNKATDAQLRDACGRDVPRTRLQDDCDHVLRQWRKLRNEGQETPYDTSGTASLDGGIDDLLGEEETGGIAGLSAGGNALDGSGADPFAEFAGETTSNPSPAAAAQKRDAASGSAGESQDSSPSAKKAAETTAPPSDEDTLPAGPVADAVDDFLEAPEAGTTRKRPAAKKEESAPVDDDFDFDDLMTSGAG